MSTESFIKDIEDVLARHQKTDEYINPHILSECKNAIEQNGHEVAYEIHKWVSDMWGW